MYFKTLLNKPAPLLLDKAESERFLTGVKILGFSVPKVLEMASFLEGRGQNMSKISTRAPYRSWISDIFSPKAGEF